MTATQIETEWDRYVWQHVDVRAITEQVLKYEFTDDSERENERLFWKGELNFFEFVVTRTATRPLIGGNATNLNLYSAEVRYTVRKDPDGVNFRKARDAISTVIDRVHLGLGHSWQDTIDYYESQEAPSEILETQVAGVDAWRTVYRFRAFQLI
jgi:hypothetical protein